MTTVAVRLPDQLIEGIDSLVTGGHYPTRTAVVRTALGALLDAHRRQEVDREIVEAYTRMPQTDGELAIADTALQALIEEEPW